MVVSVYKGNNEVLVFATDASGQAIGSEAYFEEADRNRDDYDVQLAELPLLITPEVRVEAERILVS